MFPGIYPSTLTNVRFVEEDWVYNEKSNCKVIIIAAWDLGQSLCRVSGGKVCKTFWLFNIFKVIKWLAIEFKKKNYILGQRSYTSV